MGEHGVYYACQRKGLPSINDLAACKWDSTMVEYLSVLYGLQVMEFGWETCSTLVHDRPDLNDFLHGASEVSEEARKNVGALKHFLIASMLESLERILSAGRVRSVLLQCRQFSADFQKREEENSPLLWTRIAHSWDPHRGCRWIQRNASPLPPGFRKWIFEGILASRGSLHVEPGKTTKLQLNASVKGLTVTMR